MKTASLSQSSNRKESMQRQSVVRIFLKALHINVFSYGETKPCDKPWLQWERTKDRKKRELVNFGSTGINHRTLNFAPRLSARSPHRSQSERCQSWCLLQAGRGTKYLDARLLRCSCFERNVKNKNAGLEALMSSNFSVTHNKYCGQIPKRNVKRKHPRNSKFSWHLLTVTTIWTETQMEWRGWEMTADNNKWCLPAVQVCKYDCTRMYMHRDYADRFRGGKAGSPLEWGCEFTTSGSKCYWNDKLETTMWQQ